MIRKAACDGVTVEVIPLLVTDDLEAKVSRGGTARAGERGVEPYRHG